MKKTITKQLKKSILVCGIALLWAPAVLNAQTTAIEDGNVQMEPLIGFFEGKRLLNRNSDNQHYAEYLFDGHVIRRVEGESLLWINGQPAPYDMAEVAGILVPKPGRTQTVSHNFTLPASLLNHYFGYAIEAETLVLGERPLKTPVDTLTDEVEPELTEPVLTPDKDVIEDVDTSVASEKPTQKKQIVETPEEKSPTKEQTSQEVTDDEENKETDAEIIDDKPAPTPEPEAKPEVEPEPIETEKKEPEEENKELDEKTRKEEPVERGKGTVTLDRALWGIHSDKENGVPVIIGKEQFVLYYSQENIIQVVRESNEETQSIDTYKGNKQTVIFKTKNNDFYTVVVDVIDTRNQGLSHEKIEKYISHVHKDIKISVSDNDVHLSFKHEEFNLRETLFSETEEALLRMGVQRFQLSKQSGQWDIWFNLFDSEWS